MLDCPAAGSVVHAKVLGDAGKPLTYPKLT